MVCKCCCRTEPRHLPSHTSYTDPLYRYQTLPQNIQYMLSLTIHHIRQTRLNEGGWAPRPSKLQPAPAKDARSAWEHAFHTWTTNYLPNPDRIKQEKLLCHSWDVIYSHLCHCTAETFASPASLLWLVSRISSAPLWESPGGRIEPVTATCSSSVSLDKVNMQKRLNIWIATNSSE